MAETINPSANPSSSMTAGAALPVRKWLIDEFSARFAAVLESLAGSQPSIEIQAGGEAAEDNATAFVWQQPFSALAGGIWLAAAEADWTAIGVHILSAAGLGPEDCDAETTRSSYSEALTQALGGVASALTGRLHREVTPVKGQQVKAGSPGAASDPNSKVIYPQGIEWTRLGLRLGADKSATIYCAVESALTEAVQGEIAKSEEATQLARQVPAQGAASGEFHAQNFDLLLDVELPISVSFGMAEVALKDVLKLTTGSIVELNRTILEPVEVVVNNCIIARGEVVVIEGNFGVRIKQVVSRQDRIKSLR